MKLICFVGLCTIDRSSSSSFDILTVYGWNNQFFARQKTLIIYLTWTLGQINRIRLSLLCHFLWTEHLVPGIRRPVSQLLLSRSIWRLVSLCELSSVPGRVYNYEKTGKQSKPRGKPRINSLHVTLSVYLTWSVCKKRSDLHTIWILWQCFPPPSLSLLIDSWLAAALTSACGSESDQRARLLCVFMSYLKASLPPPFVWFISGLHLPLLLPLCHHVMFTVGDQSMLRHCAPTWRTSFSSWTFLLLLSSKMILTYSCRFDVCSGYALTWDYRT